MSKNLLIVESPAKAKTIEKYLGKDFTVRSCYGHIRDLQKEKMGIDVENNFEPQYIISEDKQKVVNELKSLANKNEEIWLATDEDREGEAISWHLCEALKLNYKKTKRIVFHEITKPAILKAIENPRLVNMDLVDSQQARRVLDRLVGFKLSPLLQRKLNFKTSLSAGRVQSVAVKLIVEREREINSFIVNESYKIRAFFVEKDDKKREIIFFADRSDIKNEDEIKVFLESCKNANYNVSNIEVKKGKKSPTPPFTTSTLQQEAAKKLGYSVSRTMGIAQNLYENGYITYMRTDSLNLSQTAIEATKNQIEKQFGKEYVHVRYFKNKNENAQEAHEAIRPTDMSISNLNTEEGKKLYELIWKRTMASQMADAQIEKTQVDISISTRQDFLKAEGEVILFEGFLSVYLESNEDIEEDENDKKLPPLKIGQQLNFLNLQAKQKFTKHSARYGEAALVKKLEELGIGRPSTYASTINTIIKRSYVEKKDKEPLQRKVKIYNLLDNKIIEKTEIENYGAEKNKLFPTDLGLIVTDYLSIHFQDIMNYKFTAQVEQDLDKIAEGKIVWKKVIQEFYTPFFNLIEVNLKDNSKINSERILGKDTNSGHTILTRMARFGPIVQIGTLEETDKPIFANLKTEQSIESITLKEALELFTLPKILGNFENKEVVINRGRFGPYIQHDEKYVSIKKTLDPFTINLEQAIELIIDKRRLPRNIGIYENNEITVNLGRFGPYAIMNKNFYSLKKGTDIYNVTLEEALPMIFEQQAKKEKNTLRTFQEHDIQILKGKFGPYIKKGRDVIKINKDIKDKIETITIEEIEKYIEQINPPKKSKSKSTTINKKVIKKTIKKV